MASLDAIRNALATTINNHTQSTIFVYADAEDVAELPGLIVMPSNADYEETMNRGTDCWWFNVYVVCSRNDAKTGQAQLDGFLTGAGPDSIREIIWQHGDIGLTDGTEAMVMKMMGYGGTFSDAQIPLVGAILKVRVYTDGRA